MKYTRFKGATMYEAQLGRVYIRIPLWRYLRRGIWHGFRVGIDWS